MKVAAIQMVSAIAREANLARAHGLLAQAAETGAELAVLPEYFCMMGARDTDKLGLRETAGAGAVQGFLADAAREFGLWIVGGTLPIETADAEHVFNSSLCYSPDGQCVARYDKIHLFRFTHGDEDYDEAKTIVAGSDTATFSAPCGRVGLSICYDLRFPELYRALGNLALIVVPAAFTARTGEAHWETLLRARAIENQCYVLAAAQAGTHPGGRRTWGHSMLVGPWGDVLDVLAEGAGYIGGIVEPRVMADVRAKLPALQHRMLVAR